MYTLRVVNDKEQELILSNNPKYTVYKIEGLNPPQSTLNSSVNTTSDGSRINSVRLGNRNIVLYIAFEGNVEANRINLYKYFPIKESVTLYYTNGTRDVRICGTVETFECDLFANRQFAQISLVCPSPYFKAANDLITLFGDVSSLFEFPFSIPAEGVEFSKIDSNVRKIITNVGDSKTGINIKLYATGEVVNPVIYDVMKKTKLALNITMTTGDAILINTNVGEKSIELLRKGVTTNVMGYMTKDSNWLMLESGDNVFTYDCERGNTSLQITFTTSILYSGV